MPLYAYTVKDSAGKTKTDIVQAPDKDILIDKLQNEGYFIINIRLSAEKSSVKGVQKEGARFDHDQCKIEDLLVFSRQLATMLEAGVTMLHSLDIIVSQIQSKKLFTAITQIHDDIEQGSSLSVALVKHPRIFNQFWVSLAEVGEASGTMPLVLNKLAQHVEQDAAFQSAVLSAMVYPICPFCGMCRGGGVFCPGGGAEIRRRF